MKGIIAFITAVIFAGCAFAGGTRPYITGEFGRGIVGIKYMAVLEASGVLPVEWDIDGLPAGLDCAVSMDGKICTVSGIPEESFNGTVRVTITNGPDDEDEQSYGRGFNLIVGKGEKGPENSR